MYIQPDFLIDPAGIKGRIDHLREHSKGWTGQMTGNGISAAESIYSLIEAMAAGAGWSSIGASVAALGGREGRFVLVLIRAYFRMLGIRSACERASE